MEGRESERREKRYREIHDRREIDTHTHTHTHTYTNIKREEGRREGGR